MSSVVSSIWSRIKLPVLRSNDPQTPFKTRGRHPLLEETRFLLLTKRGPVEIVVKPTYLLASAFVGLVGAGVIAATTLFIGYKSVEVVSNDTITTAEASLPLEDPMDSGHDFMPLVNANEGIDGLVAGQPLLPAFEDGMDEDLRAKLAHASDSPAAITPVASAAKDNNRLSLTNDTDGGDLTSVALQQPFSPDAIAPPIAEMATLTAPIPHRPIPHGPTKKELIPEPPIFDTFVDRKYDHEKTSNDKIPDEAAFTGSTSPTATDALMAMLKAPFSSPFKNSLRPLVEPSEERPSTANTKTETVLAPGGAITIALNSGRTAAMVPFAPDSKIPVVNSAVRKLKMLRSMAREVESIRTHMKGLGVAETYLPAVGILEQQVTSSDFTSLTMALESHRSALNKVPLKPPMLYFYISSKYGKRKHPVTGQIRQHHGIDLAGTWQEEVHASAPGTVIHAGRMGSFGNVVRVRHAYDITTTYAHLSHILVRKGADVTHGTVIGKMGRTGRVDGAHLHYEIRVGRKSLNPQIFFDIGHRIGVGGALTKVSSFD